MSKPSGKPFVATFSFDYKIHSWGKTHADIAALVRARDPLLNPDEVADLLDGKVNLSAGRPTVEQKGTRAQAIKAAYKAMGRATSRDQRILDLAAQFAVDETTILNALARSNRI